MNVLETAPTGQTLNVLAQWYYTHCQAKNLQPRTILFYRQKLVYLLEQFGDKQPEDLTVHDLRTLAMRLQEDRKWGTQQTNHFIAVVKQFFNYLVNEELSTATPAKRLQKLKQERRYPEVLTRAETTRLLAVIDASTLTGLRNRVMLLTLLDTGLRLSELLGLDVGDIDIATTTLRAFGKGRKERVVPFSPTLAKQLVKYLQQRARFVGQEVTACWVSLEGKRLSEHYFIHSLQEYGKLAEIQRSVHPHLFRHTFATEFLRNGGSPLMLQRILGHTTQVMTQRYVHMTDADTCANHRLASPLENWHGGGFQSALGGRKKPAR